MSEFSKNKQEMQTNRDSLKNLLRKRNIHFEEWWSTFILESVLMSKKNRKDMLLPKKKKNDIFDRGERCGPLWWMT